MGTNEPKLSEIDGLTITKEQYDTFKKYLAFDSMMENDDGTVTLWF